MRVTLGPPAARRSSSSGSPRSEVNRFGWPGPVDAAGIFRDFGDEGSATRPSVGGQRALSRAVLAVASSEYLFVDEWDVAAPRERVFAAISDARTYPMWWKPVYLGVDSDGDAEVGEVSRQHFKGRLPYHLHTTSTITRLEPSQIIEADVDGDLRGHGKWTLTEEPTAARTCASTGRCSPTSRCCASSRRSCGPPSAGTTRGRSRGRARAWSRSRDNRAVKARIEPWGPGNLELLKQLMGDPAMTEHLGGPESPEKIAERQARYESTEGMFKIVDVETGEGVGSVGFWDRRVARRDRP